MKICSLYSGSSGNCYYIEAQGAKILIDAGRNARALCTSLESIGASIENIDAIFITHEHIDHICALGTISKKYHIPIHATEKCAQAICEKYESAAPVLYTHEPLFSVSVGDLLISSFLTSHDCVCPVGYCFSSDGFRAGLLTDSGIVTNSAAESLKGCSTVIIEANHDINMLKNGVYPYYLKERVASRFGHLSNDTCARFASYLAENGTKSFLLAHLSAENNSPELAFNTVSSALDGYACEIKVSSPKDPVFI